MEGEEEEISSAASAEGRAREEVKRGGLCTSREGRCLERICTVVKWLGFVSGMSSLALWTIHVCDMEIFASFPQGEDDFFEDVNSSSWRNTLFSFNPEVFGNHLEPLSPAFCLFFSLSFSLSISLFFFLSEKDNDVCIDRHIAFLSLALKLLSLSWTECTCISTYLYLCLHLSVLPASTSGTRQTLQIRVGCV